MDSDNLHEPDYIPDFKQIVENIGSTQSGFIGILWLCCEKFSYLVFYAPDAMKILGILKATNKGGLLEMENHNTETINRGMSSGAEKYSKGEFVRDWK